MWQRETLRSRLLRSLLPERIPWFAVRLYDQIARNAIKTYYREVAELVTAHANEGLILDVGTGPGYLPIEIATMAPRIRLVGIDSSKALMQIAQVNAEKAGVSNRVRFVQCDANKLDFEDDLYDMVISTGSLHAWKTPVVVINECFRVLKAGGEAWLLDPAYIITAKAEERLAGSLSALGRLAHWWGSFTSKLTPPYSVREIEEIIQRTKFEKGDMRQGKWLTVKLRKPHIEAGVYPVTGHDQSSTGTRSNYYRVRHNHNIFRIFYS